MSLYIFLFMTFFKIGCIGFGGGYAIIPIIEREVTGQQWMGIQQLIDIIAVAAMAPGPIATNCASIVGFKLAGFTGAVIACVAITLPSLLVVLILGKIFLKYREHAFVKIVFYGLRATIIGMIIFAAIKFAVSNGIIGGTKNFIDIKSFVIMIGAFLLLIKSKINPILLIFLAGILGEFCFLINEY